MLGGWSQGAVIGSDKMEISNGNVRLLNTKDKIPFWLGIVFLREAFVIIEMPQNSSDFLSP